MTAWEAREIWPIAPIGYVSLLEAADRVGRTMYGDGWRTPPETQQRQMEADVEFELVITKVATACEVGEINSACRGPDGKMVDTLPDWHAKDWRIYFRQGVVFGPTDGSTCWIFVRQGHLDHFISGLKKPPASAVNGALGRPPHDWDSIEKAARELMEYHGDFGRTMKGGPVRRGSWNASAINST
jgi:hypothetical protein